MRELFLNNVSLWFIFCLNLFASVYLSDFAKLICCSMLIENFTPCTHTQPFITNYMSPKIEELDSSEKKVPPKKSPFEVKARKTVRRSPNEVRKGLNEPQFKGNTELDRLFIKLENILDGSLETLTVALLAVRLDLEVRSEYENRYAVIQALLEYLQQIQWLSEAVKHEDKLLIKISLHDMKTFSKLINLIVIHGVYSSLAVFKIGIPLEKRQLRLFHNSKKPLEIVAVKPGADDKSDSFKENKRLLELIYESFSKLFQHELDVKDLLLKGTGYSDFLTVSAALSTIPYFDESIRESYSERHDIVAAIPDTYELMQTYSLLAVSPSPPYFKQFILSKLQLLHCNAPRNDGLLTLIELVCGLRDKENISTDAFDHVARVVLSKPKGLSTPVYFESISKQSYVLLININRPIVANCICHFLILLWHKSQLVVNDFFLKRFWSCFDPNVLQSTEVVVSESDLNNNVNVLLSLTKNGLPDDLSMAVFSPIVVNLWCYFKFLRKSQLSDSVVKSMLRSILIVPNNDYLERIARHLSLEGGESWDFTLGPNKLPQISKKLVGIDELKRSPDKRMNFFLTEIEQSCTSFVELCTELSDDVIQNLFVVILKKWLKTDSSLRIEAEEDPFVVLVDLRLLESIGNSFKDRLAKTPFAMLNLVYNVLLAESRSKTETSQNVVTDEADSDDEDDDNTTNMSDHTITVALELSSAVLSEETLLLDQKSKELLQNILQILDEIKVKIFDPKLKLTTTSFSERIRCLLEGEVPTSTLKDSQEQILKKAILSLNDPLVPVRAHGLYLLRKLVEEKSQVISLLFVLELHLNQLKDPDPFVYLNSIKGLESLIDWNEPEMVEHLTKVYAYPGDSQSEMDLDERLKIGEVLQRYIQKKGKAFLGSSAEKVVNSALHLVRRQGGVEIDSRVRMSAMSVLGICCKTNPLGIVNNIENALDCAIGILQLELDAQSSVMRRAAVVLLGDLVEGTSKTDKLPFPASYKRKTWDILTYTIETDKDVLTREQAALVLAYIRDLLEISLAED